MTDSVSEENVEVEILDREDRWEIMLRRVDKPCQLDFRLRAIRSSLLKNDQVIQSKLLSTPEILRSLPKTRTARIDSRAISLIRPLLSRKVDRDNLHKFQRSGVAWLLRAKKAILCDEMGLGKTVQAIVALRKLIESARIERALILCPKTLTSNWEVELDNWASNLSVLSVGGQYLTTDQRQVKRANVTISNYESVRAGKLSLERLGLVICDEAHHLRNSESLLSKTIKSINAQRLWMLTGTPIEKSKADLVNLLSLLDPLRFSPNDESIHQASIQSRARKYLLRRSREDVLSDLPEVTEHLIRLAPDNEQSQVYRAILLNQNTLSSLSRFNLMRSTCDLAPGAADSPKLRQCISIIRDVIKRKEKVVVFSYTLDPLNALAISLSKESINFVTLKGTASVEERNKALKTFKTSNQCDVLLASSKVGSEGLTLVEANHAVFINKWWNPSTNIQARDRIVRIGQTKKCHIYSFLMIGTVEERLELILKNKQQIFDEMMLQVSEMESFAL